MGRAFYYAGLMFRGRKGGIRPRRTRELALPLLAWIVGHDDGALGVFARLA